MKFAVTAVAIGLAGFTVSGRGDLATELRTAAKRVS